MQQRLRGAGLEVASVVVADRSTVIADLRLEVAGLDGGAGLVGVGRWVMIYDGGDGEWGWRGRGGGGAEGEKKRKRDKGKETKKKKV